MSATKQSPVRCLEREGALASDEWLKAHWFALGLALMAVVAYPQVLLGWETFVTRDFGLFAYPSAYFQRTCFWHGELPFWNPYCLCGVPFLAQWNTMPLYPPALIYLLLPLEWSLSFFCLLHLWFGGLGMYWLAHRWTTNRLAAAVAGLVFAFNGLSINLLMWPSHIATLSWMPWVVLVVLRAWQEGGRWLPVAAVVGALQMLAGGPETILFTWLLLTALWLPALWLAGHGARETNQSPWACLWRFPLVALFVAALSAAQLLPFLELTTHSQREVGFADTRWSMPLTGWANFLVPMAFGRTYTENVFFQTGQYWTSSYYLGVGTVLLGLFALGRIRQRRVLWLGGVIVVAFVCSLGDQTFVLRTLRRLIPGFTLMTYPVKFVTVIAFGLPLLAAFGLSQLREAHAKKLWQTQRQLLWLAAGLLFIIAAILGWLSIISTQQFAVPWVNGLGRAAFVMVSAGTLIALQRARSRQASQLISLVLLVIFYLDLRTHEPEQNPSVSPDVYRPDIVRTEQALKPEPAAGGPRVMLSPMADVLFNNTQSKDIKQLYLAQRLGYFSDCNLLDQVPKVGGFYSLTPKEIAGVLKLFDVLTNVDFAGLKDFLSVGYETAPGELTQWKFRPTFLPMVTAGQKPVFANDSGAVARFVQGDFDSKERIFLPAETEAQVGITNATKVQILSQRFERQKVEAEAEAKEPFLVVIAQSYYSCWQASVDGQSVPLLRANVAFQALKVPAGRHAVRVVYNNRAFRIGALISALALLGCVGAWLAGGKNKRQIQAKSVMH